MQYEIDVTPKDLRKTMRSIMTTNLSVEDVNNIYKVVAACNKHRPVDADGVHTDILHTETCGCEPECPQCNGLVWNGKLGKWIVIREVTNGVCQLCGTSYVESEASPAGNRWKISVTRVQ